MQTSTIQSILSTRFLAQTKGGSYTVDPEHRLVLIAQHESGILQLPKVTALEFHDDFIVVTSDDSHYFIPPESVFGLKSSADKDESEEAAQAFDADMTPTPLPWMLDSRQGFDPHHYALPEAPVFSCFLPSPEDTAALGDALGASLARHLPPATPAMPASLFLGLWGTLGAGKTTLVQSLLAALGHHGPVPSPTYTLVHLYEVPPLCLAHLDLYRLEHAEELESLSYWDLLDEPGRVVCVEWFDAVPHAFPPHQDALVLTLDHADDPGRLARLFATEGLAHGIALTVQELLQV